MKLTMKVIEEAFADSIEFLYLDGWLPASDLDKIMFTPPKLKENDDLRSWIVLNKSYETTGFEESIQYVIDHINSNGPFDGVLGFSLGANTLMGILNRSKYERKVERDLLYNPLFAIMLSGTNWLD